MKQTIWEAWFISSIIIFVILLGIMMLPGSKSIISLPYLAIIAFINMMVATYVGHKTESD